MGNQINRNQIVELLETKIKYKGLKLPLYINLFIENKILFIELTKHSSKNGIVFSCTANIQTDEAAFEGWCICLKHHLSKYIDSVVLSWEKPKKMTENQQLHFNRFLYRAIRFNQMFNWFDIADFNKLELNKFENELIDLTINSPLSEASKTSDASSKEKQIEYNLQNLDFIRNYFKLQNVNHQLPVGVKKDYKNFFTGRSSAIDIWGIDNQSNLNIYELKYNNHKVGIISELLFYTEVMHDLFITKQINSPSKIKNIRNAELLYGSSAQSIKAIKSHFLFDKIHPMVAGTTALINTNNFGIKFFNTQYKLSKGTFLFDKIYYNGALQLEEEIKQTSFRKTSGLLGNKHLLKKSEENLHESIQQDAKHYFSENDISWWNFGNHSDKYPTNHMVSSQIQCLNYLFALRKNKEAIFKIAQLFDPEIDDVLPTIGDKDFGFIAFEFIYQNDKLLNEYNKNAKRGAYCTSIDAFIITHRKGKKVLIPIEWKFTEKYFECDNKSYGGENNKYYQLIKKSAQLKSFDDLTLSCYYYEPFYELMRQTLLVEQMINTGVANDFLHVLIVPSENKDFLDNNYSFTKDDLQKTWRNCLSDQSKFKIIDSKQVLQIIEKLSDNPKLVDYLKLRYN